LSSTSRGVLLAVTAYVTWALFPIYLKALSVLNPFEILAHRVVGSLVLTVVVIIVLRRHNVLMEVVRSKKNIIGLTVSTCLLGLNWGVFIWAVNNGQILSASLGYYINPLVSIFLGIVFLKERLTPVRSIAAGLCCIAVMLELARFGSVPVIALFLATTFGLYGLVRKKIGVDSVSGLTIETAILWPVSMIYLLFFASPPAQMIHNDWTFNSLILLAGPYTAIPLVCFAAAANRISLAAMGFFQYIAPTGMFVIAIFMYNEPINDARLTTFVLIWTGLAVLAVDSVRALLKSRRLLLHR